VARRLNGGAQTGSANSFPPYAGGSLFPPNAAVSVLDAVRPDDLRQAGSYTLLSRLSSAGIGPVYLGRSPDGRSVVVRVVGPGLASDPGFRLRFAREVETASRVASPFTVPVIDADPDAPLPWLVTGHVPGPSLAEMVGRYGSLPVSSVLTLAAGLAAGLRAIHAAGIVHGDLKPANVLLVQDGPRLTGFGFAQAAGYARLTAGLGLAAAGFTPPGQGPGEPATAGGDIFALGAVLTFAATGQAPSGAGLAGADPGRVPGELRPLVEWCLAGNPADRPRADHFLSYLLGAHPALTARTGWLPGSILAQTAPPTLDFPVVRPALAVRPVPAVPVFHAASAGPAAQAVPAGQRAPAAAKRWMFWRRRTWPAVAVAVAGVNSP
jgi:eukaryotic-like serine/threonine-protein kinase